MRAASEPCLEGGGDGQGSVREHQTEFYTQSQGHELSFLFLRNLPPSAPCKVRGAPRADTPSPLLGETPSLSRAPASRVAKPSPKGCQQIGALITKSTS